VVSEIKLEDREEREAPPVFTIILHGIEEHWG
jgi:hypothetical protein